MRECDIKISGTAPLTLTLTTPRPQSIGAKSSRASGCIQGYIFASSNQKITFKLQLAKKTDNCGHDIWQS